MLIVFSFIIKGILSDLILDYLRSAVFFIFKSTSCFRRIGITNCNPDPKTVYNSQAIGTLVAKLGWNKLTVFSLL